MKIHLLCPFKTGDIVGAGRWPSPLQECSPPWKGEVLDINNPLAWHGSIATGNNPTQAAVDKHLAWCRDSNLSFLFDSLPVLWDFGDRKQVYWSLWGQSSRYSLRPYDQDVLLWRKVLEKNSMAVRHSA